MILNAGRPQNCVEREDREIRTYDYLDKLGILYDRVDHAPALTMEDCVAIDEALGAPMCKNLFLCNRQQTDFYLLLMPGDKPFRTKELSAQIGTARLSFANEEKMLEYLDIYPGSVSPLGLMNDKNNMVNLLIDSDVLKMEKISVHPCVNTATVVIDVKDLIEVILPEIGHNFKEVLVD